MSCRVVGLLTVAAALLVACGEPERHPAPWGVALHPPDDYRWPVDALFRAPGPPPRPVEVEALGSTASPFFGSVDLGNGVSCPTLGGTLPYNPDPVSGGMCWFNDDPFKVFNPWFPGDGDGPGGGGPGGGGPGDGPGGGGPGDGPDDGEEPEEPDGPCDNQGWDADFSDGKFWGDILDASCEVIQESDPPDFLECWEEDPPGTGIIQVLECRRVGKTCWGDDAYVCEDGGWFSEL